KGERIMTATINRVTAIGVFNNHADAQAAVNELRRTGFTESEIGVASRNGTVVEGAGDKSTNVAAGAAGGAAAGAGVGALWGLGIAAGMLPAIGPVIAGGTLAAILASAAGGAAAAGLAGALVGLGIPDDEAKHYDTEFQAGRTIVTVKASASRYAEAMDILGRNGAVSNRYA
ncbi:MAG: general stress protein, partial [Thermomicrobiales bacterium]